MASKKREIWSFDRTKFDLLYGTSHGVGDDLEKGLSQYRKLLDEGKVPGGHQNMRNVRVLKDLDEVGAVSIEVQTLKSARDVAAAEELAKHRAEQEKKNAMRLAREAEKALRKPKVPNKLKPVVSAMAKGIKDALLETGQTRQRLPVKPASK